MDSTVKEDGFQGGEGRHAKKPPYKKRRHERESGRKSSLRGPGVLVSLQVWPNLKRERRLRDQKPAHTMTGLNESRVTRRGGRDASVGTPQREEVK